MRDIADLTVTQVRIFPVDCLPWKVVASGTRHEQIRDKFSFRAMVPSLSSNGTIVELQFRNGEFLHRDKRLTLELLGIDARRITLKVLGTSADGNAVFHEVRKLLNEIGPTFAQSEPVVLADETSCVVTLDVNFRAAFSRDLMRFLELARESLSSAKWQVTLVPVWTATVEYSEVAQEIRQHDVTMSAKRLVIQPREGAPVDAKRFFTRSPSDSETHLALVRAFERDLRRMTVANRKPRRKDTGIQAPRRAAKRV